jgi:hypothetical protein
LKQDLSEEKLCEGNALVLLDFAKMIFSLDNDETPNYQILREILEDSIDQELAPTEI